MSCVFAAKNLISSICIVLETRGILTLDVFESLAERVKEQMKFFSNLPKITCAASLPGSSFTMDCLALCGR